MKVKFLAVVALIALIITLGLAQSMDASSKCPRNIHKKLRKNDYFIAPAKVVVEPLKGRHHVYGIFMIPGDRRRMANRIVVEIKGVGRYCGGISHRANRFDDVTAEPGHYLVKGFLKTRTSLWLIAQGYADRLKNRQNWKLL